MPETNLDPDDDAVDGMDDSSAVETVTHGESFVDRPYLGSRLGVIAALGAGAALLVVSSLLP